MKTKIEISENEVKAIREGRPKGGLTRGTWEISLSRFFSNMGDEMVTAVLPIFLATIGGGAATLGLIEGFSNAASSFVGVGMGFLGERVMRRWPMLLLGHFIASVKGTFAFAFSPFHIFLIRAFSRIGLRLREPIVDDGGINPADAVPGGPASRFHGAMEIGGGIIGPIIAWVSIGFLPVRQIFLFSFIPALLAIAAIFLVRGENQGPKRTVFSWEGFISFPRSFHLFLASAGVFGLGDFAHTLLILRASELLTRDHGPVRAAGLAVFLYSLRNIFYALLSYPVARLSIRFKKKVLLGIGYFLFPWVSLGFIFVPPVKSYIGWLPALLFLFFLFALAGMYPALIDSMERPLAADLMPPSLQGAGFGMLEIIKGGARFISSLVVGLLWSFFSPTAGFLYAALISFLGGVLLSRVSSGSDLKRLSAENTQSPKKCND